MMASCGRTDCVNCVAKSALRNPNEHALAHGRHRRPCGSNSWSAQVGKGHALQDSTDRRPKWSTCNNSMTAEPAPLHHHPRLALQSRQPNPRIVQQIHDNTLHVFLLSICQAFTDTSFVLLLGKILTHHVLPRPSRPNSLYSWQPPHSRLVPPPTALDSNPAW